MGNKIGVSLKISVDQIDKARLFKGQKHVYLDATVFIDPDEADQYGNHGMITQDVPKAERDAGVKGAILGNCKVFWHEAGQGQAQAQAQPQQSKPAQGFGKTPAPQGQGFDDFDGSSIPF